MTPEQSITRELANRDLGDITHLESSDPFNRYFMRRLKEKKAAIEKRFYEDPPAKVDAAEREILRRMLLEYDTLIEMTTIEKVTCRNLIEDAVNEDRKEGFRQGDKRPPIPGLPSGYD
jgi:hypothetical protein